MGIENLLRIMLRRELFRPLNRRLKYELLVGTVV